MPSFLRRHLVWLLFTSLLLGGCREATTPGSTTSISSNSPVNRTYNEADWQDLNLPDSVLYDRILGSLVGSAIGDAMGAPTEMWNQWAIAEEYGHVQGLDVVLREPSPEGPWNFNLPPGAGTDDTRWKALAVNYLISEHGMRPPGAPLAINATRFADYVNTHYEGSVAALKATPGVEPEPFEDRMRELTWLQEWAKVSRAYASGDIDAYRDATAKFYGGEMACAGMLYAPAIAAAYPGRPEAAYEAAYHLGIFDIGYARDITGLTAALTAAAFTDELTADSLRGVVRDVDPAGYFRSRLLGRVSYQQYRSARSIVRQAKRLTVVDSRAKDYRLPDGYPYDTLYYAQTVKAYELMSKASKDAPFHAGEIHLINLTALLFGDFDFERSLQFVVNYGRDNDTVAAVTGAILGARVGYSGLPEHQKERVLKVNREVLNLDLEHLAQALTEAILQRRPT